MGVGGGPERHLPPQPRGPGVQQVRPEGQGLAAQLLQVHQHRVVLHLNGNPPHAPHCRQGQALALPALSCLDLAQDHLLLMMAQAVLVLHHPHPV